MLFRRREEESILGRIRVNLWPRRSWSRSTRYVLYRLKRLSESPHAVALGFAVGVFSAATPFLGTHMVMAALIAWAVGGSIVAAVLGTFFGNPLTYPLLWYTTYEVGHLMLGGRAVKHNIDLSNGIFQSSQARLWQLLKRVSVGCIPAEMECHDVIYVHV